MFSHIFNIFQCNKTGFMCDQNSFSGEMEGDTPAVESGVPLISGHCDPPAAGRGVMAVLPLEQKRRWSYCLTGESHRNFMRVLISHNMWSNIQVSLTPWVRFDVNLNINYYHGFNP